VLHKPPRTVSDNVTHAPTQTLVPPNIGPGDGLTFTVVVTKHPVGNVYFITVDRPFVWPVTVVVVLGPGVQVAAAGTLLVHVPIGVASVSVILLATHTADGPTIGAGSGFTVTTAVPVIVREQPVVVLVATTV
jgi:hypothetical protein